MVHLVDANVLIALVVHEHVHAGAADDWLERTDRFATSPSVQGSLLRTLFRQGHLPSYVARVLRGVLDHDRHEQWLDDLTYAQVDLSRVVGHGQVTDAYLAQLARSRGGRVATLDRGFAALAPDVVDLIAT